MLNLFKKYDAYLRRPPEPPKAGKGFEAATAELAKLVRFGWDLGPAVNKVAYEYGANPRALYTFAALGPMEGV